MSVVLPFSVLNSNPIDMFKTQTMTLFVPTIQTRLTAAPSLLRCGTPASNPSQQPMTTSAGKHPLTRVTTHSPRKSQGENAFITLPIIDERSMRIPEGKIGTQVRMIDGKIGSSLLSGLLCVSFSLYNHPVDFLVPNSLLF